MWPDVLQDIAAQIKARLLDAEIEIDIYFGASAEVPQIDQINVYRGDRKPSDDQTYCDPDHDLTVYIDIWVNVEIDPTGLSDVEYENNRTLAGYQQLALISKVIRADDYDSSDLDYDAELINITGDQDAFRPTCGERIEYEIELKARN